MGDLVEEVVDFFRVVSAPQARRRETRLRRVGQLDDATAELLTLASCCPDGFTVDVLAPILGLMPNATLAAVVDGVEPPEFVGRLSRFAFDGVGAEPVASVGPESAG